MESGYIILAIAVFVLGVVIGLVIGKARTPSSETHGFLYVNPDAPEGQGLFLEQVVSTEEIADKEQVMFRVMVIR